MTTRTISLQIDAVQTRTRVAQFFDSTIYTIANELLQNARRAGATKVEVTIDKTTVTIKDDGRGIDDPAVILNFGRSNWDSDTLQRETPAGMGLASLARRTACIETRPPNAMPKEGWSVTLTPAHWRAEEFAPVERKTVAGGTTVTFEILDSDSEPIDFAVERAATFYPLPVLINGKPAQQQAFLHHCIDVTSVPGIRIGADPRRIESQNYNFHGVTALGPGTQVTGHLKKRDEADPTRIYKNTITYQSVFDIEDNQGIDLVLPARKAVVADAKTLKLVAQADAFLWATLLKQHPDVALTMKDRRHIESLSLPAPADPPECLTPWVAARANWYETAARPQRDIRPAPAEPWVMDLAHDMNPPDQATLQRALQQAGLSGRVFETDPLNNGYDWYDRLPRIRKAAIRLVTETGTTVLSELRSSKTEKVDTDLLKVQVVLNIDGAEQLTLDTDVAFLDEEDAWDPGLLVARDSTITPEDLTDLIYDAYFFPSEEVDSDSAETQTEQYRATARHMALATLESSETANDDDLKNQLEKAVLYGALKPGDTVQITRLERGCNIEIAHASQ